MRELLRNIHAVPALLIILGIPMMVRKAATAHSRR
jgi:hypothetical protein